MSNSCPNCKIAVVDHFSFCPGCGQRLKSETVPASSFVTDRVGTSIPDPFPRSQLGFVADEASHFQHRLGYQMQWASHQIPLQARTPFTLHLTDQGDIVLANLFSGIGIVSPSGDLIGVCIRDNGFVIIYGDTEIKIASGSITKESRTVSGVKREVRTD